MKFLLYNDIEKSRIFFFSKTSCYRHTAPSIFNLLLRSNRPASKFMHLISDQSNQESHNLAFANAEIALDIYFANKQNPSISTHLFTLALEVVACCMLVRALKVPIRLRLMCIFQLASNEDLLLYGLQRVKAERARSPNKRSRSVQRARTR